MKVMFRLRLRRIHIYLFSTFLLGFVFAAFYSSVNKPETASATAWASCTVNVYPGNNGPLSIRAVMTINSNGIIKAESLVSGWSVASDWVPYLKNWNTNYYHTYSSGGGKTVTGRFRYTHTGSSRQIEADCPRGFTLNSPPEPVSVSGSCSAAGRLDVYVDVNDPDGGTPVFTMHIDNVGDFGLDSGGTGWRGAWYPPRNGATYSIFIHVIDPQTGGVYGPYYGSYICPPPPVAPTCSLSVNPAQVAPGGSSTLSWTSANATSFSVDQGIGALSPVAAGSRTVFTGASTKTYTGSVSGAGGSANCSTTLSVSGGWTCTLQAPPVLEPGQSYWPMVFVKYVGSSADVSVSATVKANNQTSTFGPVGGSTSSISATVPTSPAIDFLPTAIGSYIIDASISGSTNSFAFGPTPCDGVTSVTVANKPYFKVFNGSVTVGAGFNSGTTTCTTPSAAAAGRVSGFATSSPLRGASTQYDLKALAPVATTFYSSGGNPPASNYKALTFANNVDADTYGGNFGGQSCITDYYTTTRNATVPTDNNSNRSINALDTSAGIDNQIDWTGGTYTLTVGNLAAGGKLVVYVTGNVYITGNITLASSYNNVSDIPFFALVVKGNIMINPSVTTLDGLYIAQPNGATGGGVYTCATSATTIPAASALYGTCGNKLTFNGSVVARTIKLLRTRGTLNQAPNPGPETSLSGNIAEVFNGMPELFIANPAFKVDNTASELYDSITNLPPLL